ncbi:MAG: AAA family ATPase [Promethearchaeota archaeon]
MELDIPWVEKYRPKSLSDVVSHAEIVDSLMNFVREGAIPHLIFTGPAGTGKTSTALALARDFLGDDFSPANILEMNASDTVRMETVRTVLKRFIGQDSLVNDRLKFAILDEADNIPKTVQQALRRMIELSSRRVRFVLLCNYPDRIIDPILSRCAVFRFPPLPRTTVIQKLREIATAEGIEVPDDILEYTQKISRGDLRKSINLLQMVVTYRGDKKLTREELFEVAGLVPDEKVRELLNLLEDGNFRESRKLFTTLVTKSSPRTFLFQLTDEISTKRIPLGKYGRVLRVIGRYDFRFTQDTGNRLQYDGFLADLMYVLQGGAIP